MTKKELQELTQSQLQLTNSNVIGVFYGQKIKNNKYVNQTALVYNVKKKLPLSELSESEIIPSTITNNNQTLQTDVVQAEIFVNACDILFNNDQVSENALETYRPILGGISVAPTHPFKTIGTLGFLALDEDDTIVGITNAHILQDYDPFIASSRPSDGEIRNEKGVPVINRAYDLPDAFKQENQIGLYKKAIQLTTTSNTIDAAAIALKEFDSNNRPIIDVNTSWQQLNLSVVNQPPTFATDDEITALFSTDPNDYENLQLYISSRTTGAKGENMSRIRLVSTSSSTTVPYRSGLRRNARFNGKLEFVNAHTLTTFTDCIRYTAYDPEDPTGFCYGVSLEGDSGSAILAVIDNRLKIIGLNFSFSITRNAEGEIINHQGIACKITNIAEQLRIKSWNGGRPKFSDLDNIREIVAPGLDDRQRVSYKQKNYWSVGLTSEDPTLLDNILRDHTGDPILDSDGDIITITTIHI